MRSFICPVCGKQLFKNAKNYECENKHNFDISKSGYVNLLMSQQIKDKRHGDDKIMVRSRRDFLDRGYYQILLEGILDVVKRYSVNKGMILDAGCGECWYTAHIFRTLSEMGKEPQILGIDISKNALELAHKRHANIERAVASVSKIPVASDSCDMLLNIFAPYCESEYGRVLKREGIMVRVIPLEKHLRSLKNVVYDKPYENVIHDDVLETFEKLEVKEIRSTIHIDNNADILNLFTMTPYYYKTSEQDYQKLKQLNDLDTEVEFGIIVYKKVI